MMFSVPLEINLGVITVWSGSIANIPPGWTLCDGTQGTPDLRDRFVPSAGPTFAVDDVGGSQVHNHAFTSDTHFHSFGPGTEVAAGPGPSPSTTAVAVSGITDNAVTVPPFFALAYIQFIGV